MKIKKLAVEITVNRIEDGVKVSEQSAHEATLLETDSPKAMLGKGIAYHSLIARRDSRDRLAEIIYGDL